MLVENIKPIITWLHHHQQLAGMVTFLLTFTESLAIVGLFVPGAVIMIAIGILVGTGVLPAVTTIIWASSGAFVGDVISFWLGRRYHAGIRQIWPMRAVPTWLDRGEIFFSKHGGKGIFWGRFIGPIRSILPLIAGSMRMHSGRFLIVDLVSAIFWAPIYMLPGIIIGSASMAIAPNDATRLTLYIVGILFVIWLLFWLLKRLFGVVVTAINNVIKYCWQRLLSHSSTAKFCHAIQQNPTPENYSQLTLLLCALLSLVIFTIITIASVKIVPLLPINTAICNFFRSVYNPGWHHVMVALTLFFDPRTMALIWAAIAAWLLWQRNWSALVHWLLVGCIAIGLAGLLKRALLVPRPIGLLNTPMTGAYPSGHTALATAFFGFAALLLSQNRSQITRSLIYSGTVILILLNGLSRLYLGVHWLTDVLGGILLGLTVVLFAAISYRREPKLPILLSPFLMIILAVLTVCWSILMWRDYAEDVHNYAPHTAQYTLPLQTWWQLGLQNKPLYRANRFGRPVQTMNIEWLGNLCRDSSNTGKRRLALKTD